MQNLTIQNETLLLVETAQTWPKESIRLRIEGATVRVRDSALLILPFPPYAQLINSNAVYNSVITVQQR
ncbi:MAG: hypothetical protein WBJ62_01630, partial [Coriobacteriia bacterium]